MEPDSEDTENLCTFDFGIESGNVISDSDYIWCACDKEGLQIKNIKETANELTPHHHFGIASNQKYSIKFAKDFEFNNQRYLLIALEVNKQHQLLVLFKVSISKVVAAFRVPFKVTQIEILVRNRHFIDNDKNPTFLRNFEVSAICGCIGGAICLFDVTPHERLVSLQSNEYSPLEVNWIDGFDLTDYDDVQSERLNALNSAKICGLVVNRSSISEDEFMYKMPDDSVSARIPNDQVKISSMKYEKQIDSLLIGFNFACFQIWNMKTLSIESSSEYGENNRPIVGFSLMQPQNDPKKCVYLMIAHSSLHTVKSQVARKPVAKAAAQSRYSRSQYNLDETNDLSTDQADSSKLDDDDDALDTDDEEECDSSFVIIYQLMFGKRVNIYLNQNDTYMLYEGLNYCALVFQHKLTSETLQCVKTNFSNEFKMATGSTTTTTSYEAQHHASRIPKSALSKIISIRALSVTNDRLQMDLTCIVWTLIDKQSPNSGVNYYFALFNLNNWYVQCMPSKLKPLSEFNAVDGTSRKRKNIFFSNYSLALNNDLDSIKLITVIESKIKRLKNNGIISPQNPLRALMKQVQTTLDNGEAAAASNNASRVLGEDDESTNLSDYNDDDHLLMPDDDDDDTHLSMSFDLLVLTSFNLFKLSIQPVEQQIHEIISKQEDLIHYPERIYQVLSRYHLIDRHRSAATGGKAPAPAPEAKFIPVLNYLLETSQIYPILKSLWKLSSMQDTSILSDFSLKAVLDWSWSKVVKLKQDINNLHRILSIRAHHYLNHSYNSFGHDVERHHLNEFLNYYNIQLESLIQIFKQFIKMHTTEQGHAELNKKLCVVQSIKCFVEHVQLFHKFELVMPPSSAHLETEIHADDDTTNEASSAPHHHSHSNFMKEMQINLKIIRNRWTTRRSEQRRLRRENNLGAAVFTDNQAKYPFTYMIDCVVEECKLYANTSRFFIQAAAAKADADDDILSNNYPPSSLFELLEVCLECNLSTKMKQVVILYLLCDLMHTEVSPVIQKHILKLINSYCSTSFTLLSTSLDSTICLPWSSSATSILTTTSNDNNDNSGDISCLFDLVNGLYLIDSQFLERAFKYLRVTDLSYLESYEKYFILYNSMHVNDFKTAAQYLWLFQKVNSALMDASSGEIDSGRQGAANGGNGANQQDDDFNNKVLFKFFTRSTVDAHGSSANSLNAKYEQRMHLRLLITIYLANSLVNEAYEFTKQSTLSATSSSRLNKELIIHFFIEAERFKLWKQVIKLSASDHELLAMLFAYLEAKQDLSSICIAIDLHVTNRNYTKAIQLYEKYSKQIHNSEYNYLTSMIEIAKEMVSENSSIKGSKTSQQPFVSITSADIRETAQFVYTFSTPLSEICKFSKRCVNLIKSADYEDTDYIELLKLPAKEATLSRFAINPAGFGDHNEHTGFSHSIATPSMLAKSLVKRQSSTPHPHSHHLLASTLLSKHQQQHNHNTPPILKNSNRLSTASEHKSRVLASSLKPAGAASNGSTTKSVKFQLSKFTRHVSDDDVAAADSPAFGVGGDNIENEYDDNHQNVECKKLFNEEDDDEDEVVVVAKTNKCTSDDKWFAKSKEDIIQNISLSSGDLLNSRRSKTPEVPVNYHLFDDHRSVSRKSVNLIDLRTPVEEALARKQQANKGSPPSSKSPPKAAASFIADSFKLALDASSNADPGAVSPPRKTTSSSITITKRVSNSPNRSGATSLELVNKEKERPEVLNDNFNQASASADDLYEPPNDDLEDVQPAEEPVAIDKRELAQEDHDSSLQELLSYAHSRKSIRLTELDSAEHRASPVDLNKSSYYEDVEEEQDLTDAESEKLELQETTIPDQSSAAPAEQPEATGSTDAPQDLPSQSEEKSVPIEEQFTKPDEENYMEMQVESLPPAEMVPAEAHQVQMVATNEEELNQTVEMECSFTAEVVKQTVQSEEMLAQEEVKPDDEEAVPMNEDVNKSVSASEKDARTGTAGTAGNTSVSQQSSASPVVIKRQSIAVSASQEAALNTSAEDEELAEMKEMVHSQATATSNQSRVGQEELAETPVKQSPEVKADPGPKESPVAKPSQSQSSETKDEKMAFQELVELKQEEQEMADQEDQRPHHHPNLNPEKFKEISDYIKANEKLSPSKIEQPDDAKDVSFTSNIIEGTIESDKEDDSSPANQGQGSTDNSFDLNLSSVSAAHEASPVKAPAAKTTRAKKAAAATSTAKSTTTATRGGRKKKEPAAVVVEDVAQEALPKSKMTRAESGSSIFSHLTSVSERVEKMRQAEEVAEEDKTPVPSRRGVGAGGVGARKKTATTHMMDDNELSVKKATEEAAVAAQSGGPNKCSIRRRMSDMSGSNSSASEVSTASAAARAKLRANLQSLPQTLGSNDHEVRVTRSKLKALIEQPILPSHQEVHLHSSAESSTIRATTTTTTSRRLLSTKKHHLEQVQEKDEPISTSSTEPTTSGSRLTSDELTQMTEDNASIVSGATNDDYSSSIGGGGGTLRRKRNIAATAPPPVAEPLTTGAGSRVTRSMTRSPSPSASSVISVATSVASSVASSAVSGAKKGGATAAKRVPRRGRPKTIDVVGLNEQQQQHQHDRTLKAEEHEDEAAATQERSPTNSVISISSSVASSTLQLGSSRRPPRRAATIRGGSGIEHQQQQDLESYELKSSSRAAYSLRSKPPSTSKTSAFAAEPDIVEIEDPGTGSQIRTARRTKVLKSAKSKESTNE